MIADVQRPGSDGWMSMGMAGWRCGGRGRAQFVLRSSALCLVLVLSGACSSDPSNEPTAAERQTRPATGNNKGTGKRPAEKSSPKGATFQFAAGNVLLRRAGFDRLRITKFTAKGGWRGRVDDNNDDSVDAIFFRGRRRMEFKAELDDGRLQVRACEDFVQIGGSFKIADAGTVTLQRMGDEDLRFARADATAGWHARITDNNSEDVEALFSSKNETIEFDAQTDNGRIEATICNRLK
jgi:hypothetical protein